MWSMWMVPVAALCTTVAAELRGVSPEKEALYNLGQPFTCFDGSSTIPFAHVNDDYCDCADGSDEPGTSACAQSTFYCANVGHEASNIRASAVNDGVCDCCDGTDEWDTEACTNTCEEAGRELRAARELARQRREEGSKKREAMIVAAQELMQTQKTKIEALRPDLEAAEAERDAAQKVKDEAEEPEKVAKEAADAEWDMAKSDGIEEAKRSLFVHLDQDGSGTLTLDEIPLKSEFDSDSDGQVSSEEAEDVLDRDGDGAVNETENAVDFETFKEHLYNDIQPKFNEHFPQFKDEKPGYPDDVQALINTANDARTVHSDADRKARDARNTIEDLEKKLNMDYGPNREWAQSHGECYESPNGEYTYVVCPFDKVEQKESGRAHSLGTWKGFEGPEGNEHSVMKFDGGASCWQGPQRSMTITLECGVEPEIFNVQEPSKCTYTASMRHPALCTPPSASHDEL